MSSQLHLSFTFSHPVCMYFVPHVCHLSCPYNSPLFGQPNLVQTEKYEAPHYGIFSIFLSLPLSWNQTSFSAQYFEHTQPMNLCSSLKLRYKFSHTYTTKPNYIFVHLRIYI
jgi:hypothetical protein